MRIDRTRIFLGSSHTMIEFCRMLATKLSEDRRLIVSPWYDPKVFPQGKELSASMEDALKKNDFFVFLLSPDFQPAHTSEAGDERLLYLTRRNVVLEIGAVWGRYGRERLILFCDPKSPPPSDFSGVHVPRFNANAKDREAEREVDGIVKSIRAHIDGFFAGLNRLRLSGATEKSDGKRRWISFIDCAPGAQEQVVKDLLSQRESAFNNWGVELEEAGVIWGREDGFILFSAPTDRDGTDFLKKIRASLKRKIFGLDTRSIFTDSYWSIRSDADGAPWSQICLFGCEPEHVEDVFCYLGKNAPKAPYVDASSNGAAAEAVGIRHLGILLGADDIFCMLQSDKVESLHGFVKRVLQELAASGHLRRNSSSLLVTR